MIATPLRSLFSVLLFAMSGCSIAPPRAWERDLLARPAMLIVDDALDQRFSQHIYASKENSSGGSGVGGGGCGCN